MKKVALIIGICFILAGCKATYTFENKSSFAVTIMPEYGDDFQIQSGAIKSFESSHKNMRLNYNPAKYVQSRETATRQWEFTDGEFFLEENRGFIIYPPASWEVIPFPGLEFKAIIGPVENNFAPNINFIEESNPFSDYFAYLNFSMRNMQEAGTEVLTSEKFITDSGFEGRRIETNTENLLQIYYVFDTTQRVFIVTCSAPLQSSSDYAKIFDESVRTLEFLQ